MYSGLYSALFYRENIAECWRAHLQERAQLSLEQQLKIIALRHNLLAHMDEILQGRERMIASLQARTLWTCICSQSASLKDLGHCLLAVLLLVLSKHIRCLICPGTRSLLMWPQRQRAVRTLRHSLCLVPSELTNAMVHFVQYWG